MERVDKLRVLSIQLHVKKNNLEDVAENYKRAYALLELGSRLYHPNVILLPEGFASYDNSKIKGGIAEEVPGATTDKFCQYSAQYNTMIIFGLIRRNPVGEGCYNSAVLIDHGKIVGICDKTHLYMDPRPCANEQAMFLPGKEWGLFDTVLAGLA